MQYRPVCYLEKERDVSSSTETGYTNIKDINNVDDFNGSIVPSFFGDTLYAIILQGFNISFGIKNGGYYSMNNYTSFSLLVGVGDPVPEHLSIFVIVTGLVGLGVPIAVLLFGGVYLMVKKCRRS